ncbi:MAG: M48 family metalloprotease [Deltaproteobacteria bacterium]|nr:M48 family metalloprotease [Deltaproteobacteria bacterium]
MTREQFDILVKRLEPYAKENPKAYRRRVLLLGLLGYAYIFFILAIDIIIIALMVSWVMNAKSHASHLILVKKLAIPLVLLVYITVRALWIKIAPPEGKAITRADAPELFASLDKLQKLLNGPAIHKVLLNNELNAFITQIPMLGPIGMHRNYLVLGLPCMTLLSPRQFASVLAHEYGHLSSSHGKLGTWVYRINMMWHRMVTKLVESEHFGAFIFTKFFNWYAPYFDAYTFVLRREHEHEADKAAVRAAGKEAAAESLILLTLASRYLDEKFWPNVYENAYTTASPSIAPFSAMPSAFTGGLGAEKDSGKWLDNALKVETGTADTHPSLADRIAAMGHKPTHPAPAKENAAKYFLKDKATEYASFFDTEWQNNVREGWGNRFKQTEEARKKLKTLEEKDATEGLSEEETYERGWITEDIGEPDAALPFYNKVLEKNPAHAGALFLAGRILVKNDDPSGAALIDKAMELDPECIMEGTKVLYYYFMDKDKKDVAAKYLDMADKRAAIDAAIHEERNSIFPGDTFFAPALTPEAVEGIKSELRKHPEVKSVYVAQKTLRHSAKTPLYVICIVKTWNAFRSEKSHTKTRAKLADNPLLDAETIYISVTDDTKQIFKKLKKSSALRIDNA